MQIILVVLYLSLVPLDGVNKTKVPSDYFNFFPAIGHQYNILICENLRRPLSL